MLVTIQRVLVMLLTLGVTSRSVCAPPEGFVADSWGGGFGSVVGVAGIGPSWALAWERSGKVWAVSSDGARVPQPVIDISDEVQGAGDQGLLGLAVDPAFPFRPYVYLFYVVDRHHLLFSGTPQYNPNSNLYFKATIGRITRYQLELPRTGPVLVPSSRKVLLGVDRSDGVPVLHNSHSIGSLAFGTDGTLIASTGDNANFGLIDVGGEVSNPNVAVGLSEGIISEAEDVGAFRAQLIDSLCGKILRIDADTGDGIPSNPWFDAGAPRSARSRVWAIGFRNPFRIAVRSGSGSHDPDDGAPGLIQVGDVGSWRAEELTFIRRGGVNGGWPLYEGQGHNYQYWRTAPENLTQVDPRSGPVSFKDLIVQDSQVPQEFLNGDLLMHAEVASSASSTATVQNSYDGFLGSGYRYVPSNGWVEWAPMPIRSGSIVAIRYCNGQPAAIPVTISANGQILATASLDPTGSVNEWRIKRVALSQSVAGDSAGLRVTKLPGTAALYLDAIWVEGSGESTPHLPASLVSFVHHRPALDWRTSGAGTPGFNALGAATKVTVGTEGGAAGQSFDGACSVVGPVVEFESWPQSFRGALIGDYVSGWLRVADAPSVPRCGRVANQCSCIPSVRGISVLDPSLNKIVGIHVIDSWQSVFVSRWDSVTRIRWLPGGSMPPNIVATASVGFGASPLAVTFDASDTVDPEGSQVQFHWDFGDGTPATPGAVVSHVFENPGRLPIARRVRVVATDAGGAQSQAELLIGIDNSPPSAQIVSIADGQLYPTDRDSVFPLRAQAWDPDHADSELMCEWQTVLHHDTHDHPEPIDTACVGSTQIHATPCSADAVYWYEIRLKVTDPTGLSASDSVTITPDCDGDLACQLDLNRDGYIDSIDLGTLLTSWGQGGPADVNRDGFVDSIDLGRLLNDWGPCGM